MFPAGNLFAGKQAACLPVGADPLPGAKQAGANAPACLSRLFDAVDLEPADQVLDRQLLGQQLLVGGAPVLSRGAELVHVRQDLVPLLQEVGIQAVVGRQSLLVRHHTLNRK